MSSTGDQKICANCGVPILPRSPSGQGWVDKKGKTTCEPGKTHRPA